MGGDKDNKSIVEKAVDAVKEFATSISEAAQRTAEPEPTRSDDEVMMTPVAAGGLMDETGAPPLIISRRPRKSPRKARARASKKATKKRSAKKTHKKTSRKSAKRAKTKKGKRTVGKTAKKTVKQTKKKKTSRR